MSDITTVPLSKLYPDPRNVRKSPVEDPASEAADAELQASILSHGLIQNLVVSDLGDGTYGVIAGARRLRALKALADRDLISRDIEVRVRLVEAGDPSELSLAENSVRVAMHPADQAEAFTDLIQKGATIEQVAQRFGVSERTVQKRARLGGLAPEILSAYREGKINGDTAEAFATTSDAEVQKSVYEQLSKTGGFNTHMVRSMLGQRETRSDSPLSEFVGLDAYREAGGKVEDPLFDEGYVTIFDPKLMRTLAEDRLRA